MTLEEIKEYIPEGDYDKHKAWSSFVEVMKHFQYGAEALNQAWYWYSLGWECLDRKNNPLPRGCMEGLCR